MFRPSTFLAIALSLGFIFSGQKSFGDKATAFYLFRDAVESRQPNAVQALMRDKSFLSYLEDREQARVLLYNAIVQSGSTDTARVRTEDIRTLLAHLHWTAQDLLWSLGNATHHGKQEAIKLILDNQRVEPQRLVEYLNKRRRLQAVLFRGNFNRFKRLLELPGINVNQTTLLEKALDVAKDEPQFLELILTHDDFNPERFPKGSSFQLLRAATAKGNLAAFKMLVEIGGLNINENDTYFNSSPISRAANVARSRPEFLIYIVQHPDFDPETAVTENGETPIDIATNVGSFEAVKALILSGYFDFERKPNRKEESALFRSIAFEKNKILKLFIEHGASQFFEESRDGYTALEFLLAGGASSLHFIANADMNLDLKRAIRDFLVPKIQERLEGTRSASQRIVFESLLHDLEVGSRGANTPHLGRWN